MLENDEEPNCLPSIILQGMGQGTLIWNGEKPDMHGIPTAEQRFADYAQKAIKAVYTEFDPGSAVVVDDDLRDVLTWKTTRPPCVQKLELMDASGKVLLDRPVVKTVADRLRQPDHSSEEKRNGEALAAEFDSKPFGWDDHVVRAALAALLRTGAVVAKLGTIQVRTASEPKAIEVFSGWNQFKKAVFEYVGELTPEQRMAASQALHSLFDRAGEDTFEKIDRALGEVISGFLPKVIELVGVAEVGHLPCLTVLTEFRDDLQAIQQAAAGSARIRAFLQTERQTRLANDVPAFKSIRDFKENGSLDLFQKIQGFVTYPATQFVQRAGGDLTAQLAALRGNLNHSEFYAGTRWSSITQAHMAIRQRYVSDYRQDHTTRQTQITSAKANLTAHRNWGRLDEAERRSILDQFETKECASDPGTLDEAAAFVCTSCQADASTLALQAATIGSLLTQAIARLDALDAPGPRERPDEPGPGTSGPIFIIRDHPVGSSGDIETLARKIRAVLQKVIPGGQVKVDVQFRRESPSNEGA